MLKIIKILFYLAISSCVAAILFILISYLMLKPDLPKISLVDETNLQMPLKIYTKDKVLIGEFGEIKRRPLKFDGIPLNIKNAFLAAEDDAFFEHQGISYSGLLRSIKRCLSPQGCLGGGGGETSCSSRASASSSTWSRRSPVMPPAVSWATCTCMAGSTRAGTRVLLAHIRWGEEGWVPLEVRQRPPRP